VEVHLGRNQGFRYAVSASRRICGKRVGRCSHAERDFNRVPSYWTPKPKHGFFVTTLTENVKPSGSAARKNIPRKPKQESSRSVAGGNQPETGGRSALLAEAWNRYTEEKMPDRPSTRRGYITWAKYYTLPKWGSTPLLNIKARDVELWLADLDLAPKSKVNTRMLMSLVFEYAIRADLIPVACNPMELVCIKNASPAPKEATHADARRLSSAARQPDRAIQDNSYSCGLLGLAMVRVGRVAMARHRLAGGQLILERAVVKQIEGDVKTVHSAKPLPIDPLLLEVLKQHKQRSEYTQPEDWLFASPEQFGKLPRSYTCVYEKLGKAAIKATIGHVSMRCFRHSFRSWLDSLGTPISVRCGTGRSKSLWTCPVILSGMS
jgi:integrase